LTKEDLRLPHVFISHGKQDSWIAGQVSKEISSLGATTFLDEANIKKGDDFKKEIHRELADCTELIALFTPWSMDRAWVWVEIGAAWGLDKRIIAVLCGMDISDLEGAPGGEAVLGDLNIISINDLPEYLSELEVRAGQEHA